MSVSARITDLGSGVLQVTQPLPWGLDHVHCYVVRDAGGLTVIDSGLGTPGTLERWRAVLLELGDPTEGRLIITHYHPDHLGAAADLAELARMAEIVEGELDTEMAQHAWGEPDGGAFAAFLRLHGMPDELAERSASEEVRLLVTPIEPSRPVNEGDSIELAGETFDVLVLPGHADGHIALLGRDSGRLFGGDVLLAEITPNIGRWTDTAPDPLGRYFATLDRLEQISPAIVYPGHGPLITDVASRAAELRAHHEDRLDVAERVVRDGARTAYEVARGIWPAQSLNVHEERFALAEALAHLDRLAVLGRARSLGEGRWAAAA